MAAGHGEKQQPPRSLERLIGSLLREGSLSVRKVEALFHGKRRIDRGRSRIHRRDQIKRRRLTLDRQGDFLKRPGSKASLDFAARRRQFPRPFEIGGWFTSKDADVPQF